MQRTEAIRIYIVFVDVTKNFDLTTWKGHLRLLPVTRCSPNLLSVISIFHHDTNGTEQFDGSSSDSFSLTSEVKQSLFLVPTFFHIFLSLLLSYSFRSSVYGILLHTRPDGRLFNAALLRAKTRIHQLTLRMISFANDVALFSHSQTGSQRFINSRTYACKEFRRIIILKKTISWDNRPTT